MKHAVDSLKHVPSHVAMGLERPEKDKNQSYSVASSGDFDRAWDLTLFCVAYMSPEYGAHSARFSRVSVPWV